MSPWRRRSLVSCIALIVWAHLSPVQAETPFRFTESSVNSEKSDWLELDEDQVFFRKLTHQEEGRSWTIKIGKGGQIYSIRTPALGELVAYQRAKHGQWVDEVFQHVLPMAPQKSHANRVVDGDVHQAGYYTKSDLDSRVQIIPRSVYSPLFGYRYDPAASSVSYITWPQHAHLPRSYAENLVLIGQTIKDLGGGVIEIRVEINKWGGARNDKFNLPWSALRTSTLPVQVLGNRDGSYRVVSKSFMSSEHEPKLQDAGTGGWMALVSADSPSGQGIGIVFGKDPREIDEKNGIVRWGTYGPAKSVGGTVATVRRHVRLDAGESLYYRYYLVLGTLAEIQAKANALESQVVLNKLARPQERAERQPVCLEGGRGLGSRCAISESPLFKAYKDFIPHAQPLFLLENARTEEQMLTNDPYEISFDPTDGTTKYVDFLGWAVPAGMAGDKCRHQPLSEAVSAMPRQPLLGRNSAALHVLRTNEAAC